MGDRDDIATTAIPPKHVLHFLILQRVDDFLQAQYEYESEKSVTGFDNPKKLGRVKSRLSSLFSLIRPAYHADQERKKSKNRDEYSMEYLIHNDYISAFNKINDWLYKKGMTRFDTQQNVDWTDIEQDNAYHTG